MVLPRKSLAEDAIQITKFRRGKTHDGFPFSFFRNSRYFSGLLSAVLSGFVTYVFLEPLFVPVGLELALVVLSVISINAGLVGMSLGVLLPTIFPGVCPGVSSLLFVGSRLELSTPGFRDVVAAGAVLGGFASLR